MFREFGFTETCMVSKLRSRVAASLFCDSLLKVVACEIVVHRLKVLVGRARRVAVPLRVEVARRFRIDHLLHRLAGFEKFFAAFATVSIDVAKLLQLFFVREVDRGPEITCVVSSIRFNARSTAGAKPISEPPLSVSMFG